MSLSVDLNADMGESFGPWVMGRDADLMEVITSANIACGMHAGDWDTMEATMRSALEHGVAIGCHPGFPDLQGFGRRNMKMPLPSLRNLVRYQLGTSLAMARAVGGEVRHLKLHGALANMCSRDAEMARAAYVGALSVMPEIVIYVIAATAQQEAAEALGARWEGEIFADRAYEDDATLVDRSKPGAVIHDAEEAGARMVEMVREGAIITASGKRIETRIDTICCHGDTPEAVEIARGVRARLEAEGIAVRNAG